MAVNNAPDIHENIICANIFIRHDDTYIVMKRSPEKIFAPNVVHPFGGKVDLGENPLEAATREVQEETGITVTNIKLEAVILEINSPNNQGYNWVIFHFSGDYESGDIIETEEGVLHEYTADEIKQSDLFPSVRATIDHILDPHDGTVFITVRYDDEGNIIPDQTHKNICAL